MNIYVVVFKQKARGCRDALDCGTLVKEVEATSMLDALGTALEWHGYRCDYDHWPDGSKHEMHSVTVYKMTEKDDNVFEEHRERVQELHRKSSEAKELADQRKLFSDFKKQFPSIDKRRKIR